LDSGVGPTKGTTFNTDAGKSFFKYTPDSTGPLPKASKDVGERGVTTTKVGRYIDVSNTFKK